VRTGTRAASRHHFNVDQQRPLMTVDGPAAKDGLTLVLDAFETDAGFTQIRDLAYVLATVRWETGQTFQPVKEKRASKAKNPRLWKIQNGCVSPVPLLRLPPAI
jgi:hypothetical protein